MIETFEKSLAIWKKAVETYKPSAIVIMFSGGNDSLTAFHVAKHLNIPLTHFVHGITRTGIKETTEFARTTGINSGLCYLEADAGTAYEDYVLRKGFFGRGHQAHTFAYHVLKAQPFRKVMSKIRQRRRDFKIILLNGARADESNNRKHNFIEPFNRDPAAQNNIWVNLIHDWSKQDCSDFLTDMKARRNPVTELLCRSGECMCGTMQSQEARQEASYWFPEWGQWLDRLEKTVTKKFPWRWGNAVSKSHLQEIAGQTALDFQPTCQSCIHKESP